MISEMFLLPIIFLCAFFKELYHSLKMSKTKRIIVNIVFSTCISVVYGFLLGIYIIVFTVAFFRITILNIWIPLITFILLLEVIQLAIVCSLLKDEIILPEVYLNVFLLGIHIHKEKYLIKFLIKLIILVTVLFILITSFIFSIYVSEETVLPIMIVTLSISILFTLMILNKVKQDELKKGINQMILYLIIFISFFSFGIIRLFLYNNLKSMANIIDIGILISSVFYAYVTIPSLIVQIYQKFLEEFNEVITYIWHELQKSYGFNKIKSKIIQEIHQFRSGLNELEILWRKGQRIKVIKRFVIALLFLVVYLTIVFLLKKYNNIISKTMDSVIEIIKNYWVSLFNGNSLYASTSFVIIISCIIFVYNLWKVIMFIRRKDSYQKIRVYLTRIFISCFFISIMASVYPVFNPKICIYVSFGIMLIALIQDFICGKIYGDLK